MRVYLKNSYSESGNIRSIIRDMAQALYTRSYLINALNKAGLPFSPKTLNHYERVGIIPREKNSLSFPVATRHRLYTEAEIQGIIKIVKEYKKNKTEPLI